MKWVENPTLKALTWVDPVTVVDVHLENLANKPNNRRLNEFTNLTDNDHFMDNNIHHRRLKGKGQPKSNIHGTNGYMVPLPSKGELLGIAHFHRPEHRQSSNYALHGHHYTHAFFTIARIQNGKGSFQLKRLSNEFMFQAQYSPIEKDINSGRLYPDGDIIQFASGLDIVGGDDVNGKLIISYGINDCEGAVLTLPMEKVWSYLMEVEAGQEVVDLMAKVTTAH